MATKDDLRKLNTDIMKLATKDDLQRLENRVEQIDRKLDVITVKVAERDTKINKLEQIIVAS